MATWLDIVILSVVEGVTEFLPISSTGHMIIAEKFLNMEKTPQLNAFLVIVQIGAILAVVSVFWRLFLKWAQAWFNLLSKNQNANESEDIHHRSQSLFVAASVVPFAVLGFLLKDKIEDFFSIKVVSWALIVGGLLMWGTDLFFRKMKSSPKNLRSFRFVDALIIGCGQCLALWPGFSRSAATIITGRLRGFSAETAADLSFIIGLPTLAGAASFKMLKELHHLDGQWMTYLGVGILIAWAVAYVCVKGFISFLKNYSMNIFAWYRIILGCVLLYMFSGISGV